MSTLTTGSFNAATSGDTASISPTADYLVYASVSVFGTGVPSLAGCGITWNQIATLDISNGQDSSSLLYLFEGSSATPTTGAVTISLTIAAKTAWSISEYNTSGRIGAPVTSFVAGANPSVNQGITLPALFDATSVMVVVAGNINYDPSTAVAPLVLEGEGGTDEPHTLIASVVNQTTSEILPALNWTASGLIAFELSGDPVGPPADTTPDAFTFTDQTGVAVSSVITSNTLVITGIDSPSTVTISGGTYSINGGAYTAVSGSISNNDTVSLRVTSSASESTLVSATLTIGGVSDQWDVTTTGPATVTISGAIVKFGDAISFTPANMGTLTSWTLTDGTSVINLLSGTETSATVPALGDGVSRVLTGAVTLEVGDGTLTAIDTITLEPPTGFSSVKLEIGFITTNVGFLFNYGGVPVIGDEFIYNSSEITLDTLGGWITPADISTTIYAIDATDGFMQSFLLVSGEEVVASIDATIMRRTLSRSLLKWLIN